MSIVMIARPEIRELVPYSSARMEASGGVIRSNVESLMKLIAALGSAGIELIGEDVPSTASGRGVRLRVSKKTEPLDTDRSSP